MRIRPFDHLKPLKLNPPDEQEFLDPQAPNALAAQRAAANSFTAQTGQVRTEILIPKWKVTEPPAVPSKFKRRDEYLAPKLAEIALRPPTWPTNIMERDKALEGNVLDPRRFNTGGAVQHLFPQRSRSVTVTAMLNGWIYDADETDREYVERLSSMASPRGRGRGGPQLTLGLIEKVFPACDALCNMVGIRPGSDSSLCMVELLAAPPLPLSAIRTIAVCAAEGDEAGAQRIVNVSSGPKPAAVVLSHAAIAGTLMAILSPKTGGNRGLVLDALALQEASGTAQQEASGKAMSEVPRGKATGRGGVDGSESSTDSSMKSSCGSASAGGHNAMDSALSLHVPYVASQLPPLVLPAGATQESVQAGVKWWWMRRMCRRALPHPVGGWPLVKALIPLPQPSAFLEPFHSRTDDTPHELAMAPPPVAEYSVTNSRAAFVALLQQRQLMDTALNLCRNVALRERLKASVAACRAQRFDLAVASAGSSRRRASTLGAVLNAFTTNSIDEVVARINSAAALSAGSSPDEVSPPAHLAADSKRSRIRPLLISNQYPAQDIKMYPASIPDTSWVPLSCETALADRCDPRVSRVADLESLLAFLQSVRQRRSFRAGSGTPWDADHGAPSLVAPWEISVVTRRVPVHTADSSSSPPPKGKGSPSGYGSNPRSSSPVSEVGIDGARLSRHKRLVMHRLRPRTADDEDPVEGDAFVVAPAATNTTMAPPPKRVKLDSMYNAVLNAFDPAPAASPTVTRGGRGVRGRGRGRGVAAQAQAAQTQLAEDVIGGIVLAALTSSSAPATGDLSALMAALDNLPESGGASANTCQSLLAIVRSLFENASAMDDHDHPLSSLLKDPASLSDPSLVGDGKWTVDAPTMFESLLRRFTEKCIAAPSTTDLDLFAPFEKISWQSPSASPGGG